MSDPHNDQQKKTRRIIIIATVAIIVTIVLCSLFVTRRVQEAVNPPHQIRLGVPWWKKLF